MKKLLLIYNKLYDNVPIDSYRTLYKELTTKNYDNIVITTIIKEENKKGGIDVSKREEDVIFCITPMMNAIDNKRTEQKIIYYIDDMHENKGNYEKFFELVKIADIVLTHQYQSTFVREKWKPMLHKLKWFPHFVNDYGLKPTKWKDKPKGTLITPYIFYREYPFKTAISIELDYETFKHPGYDVKRMDKNALNKNFQETIDQYQYSVVGGGGYKEYILKKYFEIPYCNTILIGQDLPGLYDLGFIHGKNCILVKIDDAYRIKEIIGSFGSDELQEISENGRKLVLDNHMVGHRVNWIIDEVKSL